MPSLSAIRAALLTAAFTGAALAQSAPAPTRPNLQPPVPAAITYTSGSLTISADNASLNQILADIARQTNLRITGGIADERVFGSFGPASPAAVLAQLLDGTGSNMIFVQPTGSAPAQLILTQRNGGPTPPSPPSQPAYQPPSSRNDEPPIRAPGQPPYNRPRPPGPRLPPDINGSSSVQPQQPGTPTQQSPNGVKTPQQIYDQLQQMRQQNNH